jgi:IS5 family transposase
VEASHEAKSLGRFARWTCGSHKLLSKPWLRERIAARKKVEALFAELKDQIGLRRLRMRRLRFVREQFFLAAAAQNIKRLVRFLSQGTEPTLATT